MNPTMNGLQCMYTNLDCLNNKKPELLSRISELNPDVIGLTEVDPKHSSWSLMPQDLSIEGYTFYSNLDGRGSVLYVKDSLCSSEINLKNSTESSVWCNLQLRGNDSLIIGLVYRSPNSPSSNITQLVDAIEEARKMKHSHFIIMGDFNFPGINWELQTSSDPADHPSQIFLDSFRDWYLHQHVLKPTHYRSQQKANILDLVMTNEKDMIEDIHYLEPIAKSHHVVLDWKFICYSIQPCKRVKKYFYDDANYVGMASHFAGYDWSNQVYDMSVDDMWGHIHGVIVAAVDKFVPHKSFNTGNFRRRKAVWMNDKVFAKVRKKRDAFQRYLLTRDGNDYLEYTKARNAAKAQARRAIRDYEKEVAKKAKNNPKAFYKFVNNKLRSSHRVNDILSGDGRLLSSDIDKAEEFNTYFSSVFTREENLNDMPKFCVDVKETLSDINFTEFDVVKLLQNVKPNKSPGPDDIHPRILKECAPELAVPLYILFRKSLDGETIPQSWKLANVTPIFKIYTIVQLASHLYVAR